MAAFPYPTHPHGATRGPAGDTLVMWRPARRRAARPLDETAVMGSGELGAAAMREASSEIRAAADARTDGDTPAVSRPALAQRIGTLFVKAYRIAGFVILAAILAGLATYLGTHLFFLVNRSWVAPSILTPADPRVLGFASRFVEESSRRDALLVRRAELEAHRREAERTLAVERGFQSAYALAMRADLADRKVDLARTRSMLAAYATARGSIASASDAFRASSEERLRQEHEAGVIDKDRMLGGNLQLAQIAEARLSLEARERTAQDLEVRFRYLGPTSKQVALASGETRVQIGVKLRAQDGCNVVYAMLRIAGAHGGEEPRVVVQVKRNPDARTHEECGARGYRTVPPAEHAPVPEIAVGSTHRLRAAMRGRTVDVWLDDDTVWSGDVGPEALELDGPAGVRTDNGRFEIEIGAPAIAAPPARHAR